MNHNNVVNQTYLVDNLSTPVDETATAHEYTNIHDASNEVDNYKLILLYHSLSATNNQIKIN